VTKGFDCLKEILDRRESNAAFAETASAQDFGLQIRAFPEIEMFSYADFATRTHQAIPFVWALSDLPGKKNFYPTLRKIAGCWIVGTERFGSVAPAAPIESRRKYSGVVENEQVVGAKDLGQVPKSSVPNAPRCPVQSQHTRAGAVRQWFLCNLLFRKIVVKVGDEHWPEL
jgi:hypothetical protein